MRLATVLLLLITAALYYLEEVDRMSVAALWAVEWEGRLGVRPYWISGALSIAAIGAALVPGARAAPAIPRPPVARRDDGPIAPNRPVPAHPRAGPEPSSVVVQDVAEAYAEAKRLRLGRGAKLRVDAQEGVPFTLVLDRATPEQARRALETFAGFLASVPRPPRARVQLKDCEPGGVPWNRQVQGALKPFFPLGSYRVVSQISWVDVVFDHPNEAW